jgi:hypothetical protein
MAKTVKAGPPANMILFEEASAIAMRANGSRGMNM